MDSYVKWWWSTHNDWRLVRIKVNRHEQWVQETWERPSSGTTATSGGTTAKAQAKSGGGTGAKAKKPKKPKTEKKHKKTKAPKAQAKGIANPKKPKTEKKA